jgi:hypothetical protein
VEYNYGLKNFLEKHEEEHVLRYHQAADLEYTFTSEFMGVDVSYTGQLDVIATKIYQEQVQPKLDKLKSEFDKAIETAESDFNKLVVGKYGTEEYDKAYEDLIAKKASIELTYNQNVEIVEGARIKVLKSLLSMFSKEATRLNEHDGKKGVIAVAANKMTAEGAAIQNGSSSVIDPETEELIPDCSDTTTD